MRRLDAALLLGGSTPRSSGIRQAKAQSSLRTPICGVLTSGERNEIRLVDAQATAETRALFVNLLNLGREKLLFGHQNSIFFGLGWQEKPDRSDVKTVCGDYPTVYGWDLVQTRKKPEAFACLIKEAFARGGVQTFSWHLWNPVSGKNFYDCTPAVAAILPGGAKHKDVLEPIRDDPVARRIAFALVWQNRNDEQYWVPIPGKRGAEDFKAFHQSPFTVFERDLPDLYVAPAQSR